MTGKEAGTADRLVKSCHFNCDLQLCSMRVYVCVMEASDRLNGLLSLVNVSLHLHQRTESADH